MGGHPRHGCRQRFWHLLDGGIIHAVENVFMVSGGRCVLVCGYEEFDSTKPQVVHSTKAYKNDVYTLNRARLA